MSKDAPLLVVYTAILGQTRDTLRAPTIRPDPAGRRLRFYAFTDRSDAGVHPWVVCQAKHAIGTDPRRAARYIKTNPRLDLVHGAQYSLWLDGSHRLTCNPWDMVDRHLNAADVAIARHGERNCVYQELNACTRLRKDDPAVMYRQVEGYRESGYPAHHGLHETGAVLRRLTPASNAFSAAWSREIEMGSCRDQLSVDYAAWSCGVQIADLPGSGRASPYFDFFPHR